LFACRHGQVDSYDTEFNATFRWKRPLTEGYRHEFLPGVHPRPSPRGFWRLTNPVLWKRIDLENFDVVLTWGWGYASAWLAVAAASAHRVRVLLLGESHDGSLAPRPPWKDVARRMILAQLFRQVDAFLAIGSRNREFYRSFGVPEERIFLAPYAVDNAFFTEYCDRLLPRRAELRRALGVEDGRPIIVCSGKLIERKAPLDLLRAFARVREEVPAKLVFLGDGRLRGALQSLSRELDVAEDVYITGFRQQDNMCEIYVAADLMVFPSHFETWGLVLNEAMLFGLPVICSSGVTAHQDLVLEGTTGNVYPLGDIPRLSALLRERLLDGEKTRAMGVKARERIQQWGFEQSVAATADAVRYVCRE
jgi:glycosyltransferase involved in cell wall biosynthesis